MKTFYASVKNKAAVAGVLLATGGVAMAQEAATAEASITQAQAAVLALVAVGGAALVAIALAGVGWGVGVKLIKRLRGAA